MAVRFYINCPQCQAKHYEDEPKCPECGFNRGDQVIPDVSEEFESETAPTPEPAKEVKPKDPEISPTGKPAEPLPLKPRKSDANLKTKMWISGILAMGFLAVIFYGVVIELQKPEAEPSMRKIKSQQLQESLEAKFGPKPKAQVWNGKYGVVESFLSKSGTSKLHSCTKAQVDQKKGWVVGCDFTQNGRRGAGWFIIVNNKVINKLPSSAYNLDD